MLFKTALKGSPLSLRPPRPPFCSWEMLVDWTKCVLSQDLYGSWHLRGLLPVLLKWRILNHVCRLQFDTLDFFYIKWVRITQFSLITVIDLWNLPLTPDTQASIFHPIYIVEQTQMSCTNTFLQCLFSSLWSLLLPSALIFQLVLFSTLEWCKASTWGIKHVPPA